MVRAWPAATFSRSAMECGAPERVCHSILWPHSAFFSCLSMSSLSLSASTTTGLQKLIQHQEVYMAMSLKAVAACALCSLNCREACKASVKIPLKHVLGHCQQSGGFLTSEMSECTSELGDSVRLSISQTDHEGKFTACSNS